MKVSTRIPSQQYLDSFKHIYLDMDGTIADLYGVKDWKNRIRQEEYGVYLEAIPLISEEQLLQYFPENEQGRDRIWVITMAPPDCSLDYKIRVFQEKNKWLVKYFPKLNNRVFLNHQYNKNIYSDLNHRLSDILMVDDSELLRSTFDGATIPPFWLPKNDIR